MIPYRDIIETADRRWTSRLMDRLTAPDVPEDELDDLTWALQAVSDLRSFPALEAVVADAARPARIRLAASTALRGMQHVALDVPVEKLRGWWREGDAVLRRHALLSMDGSHCPDIVTRVAADPMHPLQAEALGCMEWWFDRREHEFIKIAGLSHLDPKVRTAAARVLLWDEPVAAESALLQATYDPVPEVAAEAANTLEYYPSLRVIIRLRELLDCADAKVRQDVTDSYESIRNDLLIRLCGRDQHVAGHIRRWLRPIWDLLAFTQQELRPDEDEDMPSQREEKLEVMAPDEVLAMLADPDVSPIVLGNRLRSNGWSNYHEGERRRLRRVLLAHLDQFVREQAAFAFAEWQDVDGLLELLRDADFCVRKSAMYNLSQLPPVSGIAALVLDHLDRHDTLGTHANETLAAFVRHAEPAAVIRLLGWIAGDHGCREELRGAAVNHLAELRAAGEIRQLAGLLLEPPEVTWALHIALLDAVADLGLPAPEVGHLRQVDNLDVQMAVAKIKA
jgi:hypothetical protein